uniref:Uncharacterized protein n=1 Tax=virus sp. ctoYX9 TaxID=2825822 RepID=A0A8S5RNQ9_9VIRU|nr:MAG TPA: hypothetical protein [virus sp. ctoYX9]
MLDFQYFTKIYYRKVLKIKLLRILTARHVDVTRYILYI